MFTNKKRLRLAVGALLIVIIISVIMMISSKLSEITNTSKFDDVVSLFGDRFKGMESVESILADVENIDFYLTPDFNGYEIKTETDDETDTSVEHFYDGDKLVYSKYIGYGEDCFDFYTSSKRGKAIVVKYTDLDSKRYGISIESVSYFISFDNLNKNSEFGADMINISIFDGNTDGSGQRARYTYDCGSVSFEGEYSDTDGYHKCGAYPGDSGYEIYDDIVIDNVSSTDITVNISKIADDARVENIQLLMGCHKLSYTLNPDNTKQWFITGEVTAVFCKESNAQSFAKEYAAELFDYDDGEKWLVVFKDITIPVSSEYTDFLELAQSEIDDYFYCIIKLDSDGKLKDLLRDSGVLSYY